MRKSVQRQLTCAGGGKKMLHAGRGGGQIEKRRGVIDPRQATLIQQ